MRNRPRESSTKKFLKTHPKCCFCGGARIATTRDHIPSISVFYDRSRPKGLEFPACLECNKSTQKEEIVFSLLTRFSHDQTEDNLEEFRGLLEKSEKAFPGIVKEMRMRDTSRVFEKLYLPEELHGGATANIDGPIVSACFDKFCVKLAKALHYEFTGNILPIVGGVTIRLFTNVNAYRKTVPPGLFQYFGERSTLQQGRWSVKDQFAYNGITSEDGETGIYYTMFRTAFIALLFVKHNASQFPNIEGMEVHTD